MQECPWMSHCPADPESAPTPWRGDWRWTAGRAGCLAAHVILCQCHLLTLLLPLTFLATAVNIFAYEIRGLGLEVKTHPQNFLPSLISLTPYTQPLSSPPSPHSHLTHNHYQGVVTNMSCVEAFATGIKIRSSDQSPSWGPIKGST